MATGDWRRFRRVWRGWRFTVKELLVTTTLLAVLLAKIAQMK